jgi:GDPmannose 4,6-dehydratase
MANKVLIFGISGQDGSYLAELCLDKGHEVHGVIRRASNPNPPYKTEILKRVTTHLGD